MTVNRNFIVLGADKEINLTDDVRQRAVNGLKSADADLYEEAKVAAVALLDPFLPEFFQLLKSASFLLPCLTYFNSDNEDWQRLRQ